MTHRCHTRPLSRRELEGGAISGMAAGTRCYRGCMKMRNPPRRLPWWRVLLPVHLMVMVALASEVVPRRPMRWPEVRERLRRGLPVPPMGGGAITIWTAASASNWNTAASWSGAANPAAGADCQMGNGSGATQSNCTITANTNKVRSLNCTGYTGTLTINSGVALQLGGASAGNLTFVTGMTLTLGSATTSKVLLDHTVTGCNVDFAGKTLGAVTFGTTGAGGWTITNGGAVGTPFTTGTGALVNLSTGTLATNGQTCSWGTFAGSSGATLQLGASAISITGTTGSIWNSALGSSGVTAGTSTITISDTGASAKVFATTPGETYNNVTVTGGGTGAVTIGAGSNGTTTYNIVTINAPKTITFPINTTQAATQWLFIGGSSGNIINIRSSVNGTAATISSSTRVSTDWVGLQDNTAAGNVPFYAGPDSIIVSNVTNWNLTSPNTPPVVVTQAVQVATVR